MSDAMREAIENAVAQQIPFRLIDHPLMVGFTQRAADAVLAVVRRVDADQWEQVGVLAKDGRLHGTKNLWDGDEPVYRRVVPVVPSPEPPRTMDTGLVEVRQVRCPTCGSEYRLTYLAPCHLGGADPWHSAEAPDGRVVAQWRGPHNVEVTPPDAVLGEQA